MATLTEEMEKSFDTTIAIGEYGTQFFYFNPNQGDNATPKFEYALPLVSGGEYGGDTETTDTPELDLDFVPKISGRTTLNDVELTSNYTKARYRRWLQVLDQLHEQVYLEVFSDGSGVVFSGTAGKPTITGGDPRTITATIAPTNMVWISDVTSLEETTEGVNTLEILKDMLDEVVNRENDITTGMTPVLTAGNPLPFDSDTIPALREWAYQAKQA